MSKANTYYYFTDSTFLLELNLKKVRRELIQMIDEFEQQDCKSCLELKCCCSSMSPQNQNDNGCTSNGDHDVSANTNKDVIGSPSADLLPKPKFKKEEFKEDPGSSTPEKKLNLEIQAWLEKCKILQTAMNTQNKGQLNTIKVRKLKKSMSNGKLYDLNREERVIRDKKISVDPQHATNASAVDAFFKSFKGPPKNATPGNVAYTNNILPAAYMQQKANINKSFYFSDQIS